MNTSRDSGGGVNGRVVFWTLSSLIVFSVSFYRSFFKNFIFIKTYFFWITIFIFFSIAWSDSPGQTITRSVLWLLAGGTMAILYIKESIYGDTKKVLIITSGILLFANILVIILYPSGAFSSDGKLTGISAGKNALGASAALFSIILSAILMQFRFAELRYRLFVKLMLLIWLIFLVLSGSRSSLGFTLIIISTLYFYRYQIKYILYSCFTLVLIFLCLLPILYRLVGLDLFSDYSGLLQPELFTGRGEIWASIISEFTDYFWFGTGYGAYWVSTTRDIFEIEHSFFLVLNSAHNGYLHIFTNVGVVGLLLFIIFTLFKIFRLGFRLEMWELAILVFVALHAFFESDFLLYKNIWILFSAIITRLEYPAITHLNSVAKK
jgi:O-antigen ligase